MFRSFLFLGAVLLASCFSGSLRAFAPSRSKQMNVKISSARRLSFSRKLLSAPSSYGYYQTNVNGALRLQGSNDSSGDETPASPIIGLAPSDQGVLGGAGTAAACVMLYSEFVLLTTGCGLPAGPFGLVGLFEGLSYLGVLGIGGFSIFTKIKTVCREKNCRLLTMTV